MDQNQLDANEQKPRTSMFFWIFIIFNLTLAVVFVLKFVFG
jgi:hypothetical protein